MTRRTSLSSPWGLPVNPGPKINGPKFETVGRFSADGSLLYYCSEAANWTTLQTPIKPVVDFNGDNKVDLADLTMLISNWGTTSTLYDIGPMPWGDGKVDVEDLKVFTACYEKENPPQSSGSK